MSKKRDQVAGGSEPRIAPGDHGARNLPEIGATGAAGRADAFISYSRVEREFVEGCLVPELEKRGQKVWFDLHAIEGGTAWRERITAGIQGARSFVFVMSPASIASVPCREELDEAIGLNKPLVPVVRVSLPREQVPEDLRRAQWISLREADPIATRLDDVAGALFADIEWRDLHNELTIQAIDWNARGRDKHVLLRGGKLKEAERWQADANPHRESPTAEQAAFILASRRAATQRQRALIGAVSTAFLVAVALAVVALIQRSDAVAKQRTATSLALAANANVQLASHFEVSTLLALEAYRAKHTVEAKSAMVSALEAEQSYPGQTILRPHDGGVNSVAFSSNGHVVATAGDDGIARLWDVRTHRHISQVEIGGRGRSQSGSLNVEFSPNGRDVLSAGTDDGVVRIWDAHSLRPIGRFVASGRGPVISLAYAPSGKILATGSNSGAVQLWDAHTRRRLGAPLPGNQGRNEGGNQGGVSAIAISPDGHTLASAGSDGTVLLRDMRTRKIIRTVKVDPGTGSLVTDVAFNPSGRLLAVSDFVFTSAGLIGITRIWDVARQRFVGSKVSGQTVQFSRDGETFATGSFDGIVRVWATKSHALVATPPDRNQVQVNDVDLSPDGKTVVSAGSDGTVLVWNVHASVGMPLALPGNGSMIDAIKFSPDGDVLASAGTDGDVHLWNLRTRRQISRPLDGAPSAVTLHQRDVTAIAFSPDGGTLASAGYDGTLRFWNAHTHRLEGPRLPHDPLGVNAIVFSPDGQTLVSAGDDGSVRFWDVQTHKERRRPFYTDGASIVTLAFSADGRTLASAGDDRVVHLWDVRTSQPIGAPLDDGEGSVLSVSFSPDGRILAAATAFGTIELWSVAKHRLIAEPILTGQGFVERIAFSPDGQILASAGTDGTVRLWDVATRHPLGQVLRDEQGPVWAIAFSSDGSTLASAGSDGVVRLWGGMFWRDPADLSARVCGLRIANLSRQDWQALVPDLGYRTTCLS